MDFYLFSKMVPATHKVHKCENAVFAVLVTNW